MKLTKWPGLTPGSVIFTRPEAMSNIGYLYEIHSWGYINNQHTRRGYLELLYNDIIPKINDKTFYI